MNFNNAGKQNCQKIILQKKVEKTEGHDLAFMKLEAKTRQLTQVCS